MRSFRATVVARQVLEPVLRVAASVGLVAAGFGLPAVMGAYVGSEIVGLAVAVAIVVRLEPLRELARGSAPSQMGSLLRYSIPLDLIDAVLLALRGGKPR